MKRVRIFALAIGICMMAFLSQAQAAPSFSVAPAGSFDPLSDTTITYDVLLNVAAGESFTTYGWFITYQYDSLELSNPIWAQPTLADSTDFTSSPGQINEMALDLNGVVFGVGPHAIGSFTFTIAQPIQFFDGFADFSVLTQVGSDGFLLNDFVTLAQFAGALGADVGMAAPNPVPVPAAVWLLGSGLVGLLGFRRKTAA